MYDDLNKISFLLQYFVFIVPCITLCIFFYLRRQMSCTKRHEINIELSHLEDVRLGFVYLGVNKLITE